MSLFGSLSTAKREDRGKREISQKTCRVTKHLSPPGPGVSDELRLGSVAVPATATGLVGAGLRPLHQPLA